MKNRSLSTAFSLFAMLAFAGQTKAASVTPAGYTNDFGALPLAADWATFSRAGGAGDTYDWDVDVNANITAGGVTAQASSNATDPAGPWPPPPGVRLDSIFRPGPRAIATRH